MPILPRVWYALRALRWPFGLLVVALLPALAMLAEKPDAWIQRAGFFLQIAGFGTVFWQIRRALSAYKRPTLRQQLRAWVADLLGKPKTGATSGNAAITIVGSLYPKIRKEPEDSSVTARLEALEFNIGEIDKGIENLRLDVQKRHHQMNEKIDAERDARTVALRDLAEKIEDQAVGSTNLQLFGLVLFVAGVLYGTVPADAAWFLGRLFGR